MEKQGLPQELGNLGRSILVALVALVVIPLASVGLCFAVSLRVAAQVAVSTHSVDPAPFTAAMFVIVGLQLVYECRMLTGGVRSLVQPGPAAQVTQRLGWLALFSVVVSLQPVLWAWARAFPGLVFVAGAVLMWVVPGLILYTSTATRFERGRRILTLSEARAKAGLVSAGVPWGGIMVPLEDAPTHFMLVGAPGSGKTVTMRAMMKAVVPRLGGLECRGALVYDPKQDMISDLAGMGLTVENGRVDILNPFDQRCSAWDIAADVNDPDAAFEVATILCPLDEKSTNPYFSQAARDIVAQIMRTFIRLAPGEWTLRDVLLAVRGDQHLRYVLERTVEGQELLAAHSQVTDTWGNIRGSLSTKLQPYHTIAALWARAPRKVSLESWFASNSVLVLGSSERSREALRAINRVLFRRLSQIALIQPEARGEYRWFFIDEAKETGHLQGLEELLTRGRSKGMCLVLSVQDTPGMKSVYGEQEALSVMGLCDQCAVFRVGGVETAQWAAALLGEIEETHFRVTRDQRGLLHEAISATEQREKRDALMTAEIMEQPPPDRTYGPAGVYLTRRVGAFRSRLRWSDLDLPTPDPNVLSYVPRRNQGDQELEPWQGADLQRLGLGQSEVTGNGTGGTLAGPAREASRRRRSLDDVTPDFLR